MKTNKIETVVVGVDLSDYSKVVVREAQALAKKMKLRLVYIFAFEDADLYQSTLLDKAVEHYSKKIRKTYGLRPAAHVLIRFGKAATAIIDVAKEENNPLIIVGHKGGHAIARFFLGSVAEKLAAMTPFPLWIHRGDKTLLPNKILVPSDLSRRSERTIDEIKIFCGTFKSDVEVLHVFQEPVPVMDFATWTAMYAALRKDDDKRIQAFKRKHPNLKVQRSEGTVPDSIRRRSKGFDLIAISPRPAREKTVFGSVTSKVVRSGDTPMLIIP